MICCYDQDIDRLEVLLPGTVNVGKSVNPHLTLFLLDEDESTIVGFTLKAASENLNELKKVPLKFRVAGILSLVRNLEGLTQEEFSQKAGVGVTTIRRAESANEESMITLNTLNKIITAFPGYDYSVLVRGELEEAS